MITRSDLMDPELGARRRARAPGRHAARRAARGRACRRRPAPGWTSCAPRSAALVAGLPAPDPAADVRLWVDRAFTIRGAGTVVTGTLAAGRIRVDDELELVAAGRHVAGSRVRGLQSLGAPVAGGRAGWPGWR